MAGNRPRLRQRFGPVDLMGFGVVTLTGIEAKTHAGPAAVVSFAVAGLVVTALAALWLDDGAGSPKACGEHLGRSGGAGGGPDAGDHDA